MKLQRLPRILIVNCYSDNNRGARGNPHFVPQSLAAQALAGVLDEQHCELQIACEFASGPFEDLRSLAWPDLLVLTGLNPALDRMKQLCAYARALNPGVQVVVGGPLARVLPRLCARFFDTVLPGDVEALADLAAGLYGEQLRRDPAQPRQDLSLRTHRIGYAESSRNCNFSCSFCSMSAEGRPHQPLPLEALRRQLEQLGHQRCVMFLDQNFFAGPRDFLLKRLALLREFHAAGRLQGWAALVTSDFFARPEWMALAREAGCIGFFSGIETLDTGLLARFQKRQNLVLPQLQRIQRCLEAGLTFHYGLIHDPLERSGQALEAEVEQLLQAPVTLPSFVSLAIPLLGTPLFQQRLREQALLPGMRLRDMDGRSLMTASLDPAEQVRRLLVRMDHGLITRRQALAHGVRLWRHHRGHLPGVALFSALSPNLAHAFPWWATSRREHHLRRRGAPMRSHDVRSELLGTLYRPLIPLPPGLRGHFEPTLVTDAAGALHESLQADLGGQPPAATPAQATGPLIPVLLRQ